MRDQWMVVLICAFVLAMAYVQYQRSDYFHLTCIMSDVNGQKFCVRQRSKMREASDLLAETSNRLEKLVAHIKQTAPDDPITQRIAKRFDPRKIKEILPTSQYTAYSENKGEKLALCLNTSKTDSDSDLIDQNTLMYVALHEISHVGCVSVGHNDEFWNTFKWILQHAKSIGIYEPVDYKKTTKNYCDMPLTDNPLFDM